MPHLEETLRVLGFDDPGTALRGRRFEHFIQQIFRKYPGAYGKERFKDVWLWGEWPDRDRFGYGGDYGIDLVAQQTDAYGGGLCAIQCKYRAGGSVATGEIDSFLAAVGRPFVASLIVTSSQIAKKGEEKIRKAVPRCQILYTAVMDDWVEDWRVYVDSPESFEIPPPGKYELHDYQREALEAVVEGLSVADRGQLILPCGTGKSFLALRIAERLAGQGGRVLYLVPSIALVGQTMREWSAQRSIPLEYLGVCSDPTAGKKASERPDTAGDLTELAIPVTTDPKKIREQLTTPLKPGVMQVVFSTYHSSPLLARRREGNGVGVNNESSAYHSSPQVKPALDAGGDAVFDLIICDEAHRTTGIEFSSDREGGSYYQIVHHDEKIPGKKRLYMTATPRVFTERARAQLAENEDPDCYDMNDEAVYGKELYRMSFGEAVKAGHLSDYEILVIVTSAEAYYEAVGEAHERIVGENGRVFVDDAVKLAGCWDALASPETTSVSLGQGPGRILPGGARPARSAIAFTNRVSTSKWVADTWEEIVKAVTKGKEEDKKEGDKEEEGCPGFLGLSVGHVDGTTPAADRVRYLRRLERSGDRGEGADAQVCEVVSNARVLSEGVNVPSLDAVLFLDPRSSTIDITQQVGRVMRKAPGKKKGYIVIPVVVPEYGDPKKILANSEWRVVWQVVRSLRSHDERFNHYVNHEDAWRKNAPLDVRPARLGQRDDHVEDVYRKRVHQLRLALNNEIASMVVEKCGDRNVYHTWGKRAEKVCRRVQTRIGGLTGAGGNFEADFQELVEGIKVSVRRDVTDEEVQQMVAQHIVTIPVFDAMLGENEFSQHNLVSKDIERLLDRFKKQGINFQGEIEPLTRAYQSMSEAFEGAVSSVEKLDILRRIYGEFFKEAMPDTVKRLGLVYTPMEIVDFMVRSVAAICEKEFRRSISEKGVNVLDPFVGTGTFLARLLEMHDANGEYVIRDEDLERKYEKEIHANELVLLAYYIAALKIEEAKHTRDAEMLDGAIEYTPFKGAVFTDTFLGSIKGQFPGSLIENIKKRAAQDKKSMVVILGNPPWSAGMKSSSDTTKNIEYDEITAEIKKTYGKKHREILGKTSGVKAFGNLYVKALRWATDRILPADEQDELSAIISFVHPNSLIDGPSLAGVRAMLRDEFSDIYVVNLRGNAYKSGEERQKEGDPIFGQGTRNGVQITFLVRNSAKDLSKPAALHYVQVPDRMNLEEKFEWLEKLGDITSLKLEVVPLTPKHEWINLSDGSYEELLAVCDTNKKNKNIAFSKHALGLATNCDVYVYSFSHEKLENKVKKLISAYKDALSDYETGIRTFEEVTSNATLDAIKWTTALKKCLKRGEEIEYESWRIREVLYRPFTKLWLYEDDRILTSIRTASKMFPRGEGVPRDGIGGGGGHFQQFLSQPLPTKRSLEFSRPESSATFARSGLSRPVERSRGDSADGSVEHGDLRGVDEQSVAGFAFDGGRAADAQHSETELGGGGGGQSWSLARRAHAPLRPSQSIGPATSRERGSIRPTGSSPESGDSDQSDAAASVRDPGGQPPLRPVRYGSSDSRLAQSSAWTGIVVTTPSNRVRPAVLATGLLADLHVIDPAGRVVPRHK